MASTLTRMASGWGPAWPARALAALLARAARRLGGAREVSVELALADGLAWSRRVGKGGATVRCVAGSAVLTREGDHRDHVLAAGASFASDLRGRLALFALEQTVVVITGDLR